MRVAEVATSGQARRKAAVVELAVGRAAWPVHRPAVTGVKRGQLHAGEVGHGAATVGRAVDGSVVDDAEHTVGVLVNVDLEDVGADGSRTQERAHGGGGPEPLAAAVR